ncbi:unnamed protein product [Absidia cylindrospora]
MNKVIRDQFIKLHSKPIMENLYEEFMERYKHHQIPYCEELDTKDSHVERTPKPSSSAASASTTKPTPTVSPTSAENDPLLGLAEVSDRNTNDIDDDDDDDTTIRKPVDKKRCRRHVWKELTFAPLPKKGEFDINQVKKSDYFFH